MELTTHTSEKLLREIVEKRGVAYLREGDGKLFVNAFVEMGGNSQDVTLLRYLTQCGGHEDLLDAANLTPAMQRAYYRQTVQKLCARSLIPESYAHRICAIFWRAVYGKEPPQMSTQPPLDKPEPIPTEPSPSEPPKPYPQPVPQSRFLEWPKLVQWLVLGLCYLGITFAAFMVFALVGVPLELMTQGANSFTEDPISFLIMLGIGICMAVLLIKYVFFSAPKDSMRFGNTGAARKKRSLFAFLGGMLIVPLIIAALMGAFSA